MNTNKIWVTFLAGAWMRATSPLSLGFAVVIGLIGGLPAAAGFAMLMMITGGLARMRKKIGKSV